jgi:TPR repeat protein
MRALLPWAALGKLPISAAVQIQSTMSENDPNNHLVRVEHGVLALANLSDNKILSEMVGASLVLARGSAVAPVYLDALVSEGKRIQAGEGITPENMRAFGLFSQAALAGHPEGQYLLSDCYHGGRGVIQDEAPALAWLLKSAESGFAKACFRLGQAYLGGKRVLKNENEAIKWFEKAADAGVLGFCLHLAGFYKERNDPIGRLRWEKKGVLLGYSDSLWNVYELYAEHGHQIGGDEAEAYAWWRLYSEHSSQPTKAAELAASMSSSELARAEQRYQELRAQFQSMWRQNERAHP